MSNTLGAGDNQITLPDDMLWTDEFTWSSIVQQIDPAIDGTPIVQEGQLKSGRLITLEGGTDYGWMPRSDVVKLRVLSEMLETTHPLSFNGTSYQVRFLRGGAPSGTFSAQSSVPFKAKPVAPYSTPADTDPYAVSIYLFQVPST